MQTNKTSRLTQNQTPSVVQLKKLADMKICLKVSVYTRYQGFHKQLPAGIWCKNDVVLTSMRRDYVASTLIRRHFGTKCPLGALRQSLLCTSSRFGTNDRIIYRLAFRPSDSRTRCAASTEVPQASEIPLAPCP